MSTTTLYLKDRAVHCPDSWKIKTPDPSHRYEPVRGYCAILAVMNAEGKCIGWIDTRTLGHETAKDWMRATGYRA